MRFDARSAAVMDKAARGPAEIAARVHSRVRPKNGLVRGGSFGSLGASALVSTVASKGGSIVATSEGSSLAAAMGAGAAAGPIGLIVGAIVGIVISKIFNKQYLDVTSANTIADASYGVFQQYQQIAGQVAGRQIGLASMDAIWKGAMYAGLFPLNDQQLCFHNGCLKYKGQPEWIEATINGPDNQFTLGGNYQAFVNGAVNAAAAATTGTYAQPVNPGMIGRAQLKGLSRRFTGLGALGAINGVPEAVVLVDNYLIPANTRDNPAWLVPRTALEHQILYDVADAWLATKHPELNSTPFVATSPAASPTPIATYQVQPSPNPVPVAPQPVPVVANPPVLTNPVPTPGVITPITYSSPGLPQPILTPVAVSSGIQTSGGGATLFQAAPADASGVATTADALANANNSFSDFISTPLGLLTLVGIGVAVLAVLKK